MKDKITTIMNVNENEIRVMRIDNEDYISLTDLARYKNSDDPSDVIKKWLSNYDTIEFLGLWEMMHNPNFKGVDFDTFVNEAGSNSFVMTPQKWIESTNAIGIISRSGNGGGTFAHKDIAFEFASWLSPEFKLYLIKEFERLKLEENNRNKIEWDAKRFLTKTNYIIQTDAVKKYILPEKRYDGIRNVLKIAKNTFANFFTVQCFDAILLGILCIIGMLVFKIPYAVPVGVLVGVTALIPLVGGFIGVIIGSFLIISVAPLKVLTFIVFVVILQQVEANLIYPKIVGDSVGLPGIWVLVAVSLGGKLFGVIGMLIGVPLASVVYTIIRNDVYKRLKVKK